SNARTVPTPIALSTAGLPGRSRASGATPGGGAVDLPENRTATKTTSSKRSNSPAVMIRFDPIDCSARRASRRLIDVAPRGVQEARTPDAQIGAGVERLEAGAEELRLGVGQLDAGRSPVLEELSAHAVRLLGGREAARAGLHGHDRLAHRLPRL